ncbi:MAG TPA: anti-sigma factor [Pyrinomonadaceae bacterium]|nr:anti-sigma factor [Pyrinomonadaceae bacterium]
MNCQETQALLHGYLDGELDLLSNLEFERHVQTCPACARAHEAQQALRSALGDDALYFKAPTNLRERVQTTLRVGARDEARPRLATWRWLAVGLSFALLAIIIGSLAFMRAGPTPDELLARELVASHVRALMANHLTDVASTDQHTVKPWFDGKLDFAPTVVDLTAQGFPLVGGRLDYINNRPVAALVYQRRQHLINLFIWPAPDATERAPQMSVRQGYNLIHWTRAGMNYWAISDLNLSELQAFAQALQNPA